METLGRVSVASIMAFGISDADRILVAMLKLAKSRLEEGRNALASLLEDKALLDMLAEVGVASTTPLRICDIISFSVVVVKPARTDEFP